MEHIERSYLIVALYYVFNSMPAVWAVLKSIFKQVVFQLEVQLI